MVLPPEMVGINHSDNVAGGRAIRMPGLVHDTASAPNAMPGNRGVFVRSYLTSFHHTVFFDPIVKVSTSISNEATHTNKG